MHVATRRVAASEVPDFQRGPAQLGEFVGTELVKGARLVGTAGLGISGCGVDGGPEGGQVFRWHAEQAGGHAVRFRHGWLDPPPSPGPGMPFFSSGGVDGQYGAAGGGA